VQHLPRSEFGPSETSAQRWATSVVGGQPEAPLRRTKSPLLTPTSPEQEQAISSVAATAAMIKQLPIGDFAAVVAHDLLNVFSQSA